MVHRLDRQAGGIVVAALDRKSAAELSRQVQSRELKRTFYAVVRSCPRDKSGELTDYLIKDTATWRVRIAPRSTEGAKKAQLTYKVLQSVSCGGQTLTLLALRPATGIAHQMRVQLAGMGCPVWGDRVYGGGLEKKGSPTALWGVSTTLIHPVKGDKRTFLCYPQTDTPWKLFDIELAPDCSDLSTLLWIAFAGMGRRPFDYSAIPDFLCCCFLSASPPALQKRASKRALRRKT